MTELYTISVVVIKTHQVHYSTISQMYNSCMQHNEYIIQSSTHTIIYVHTM